MHHRTPRAALRWTGLVLVAVLTGCASGDADTDADTDGVTTAAGDPSRSGATGSTGAAEVASTLVVGDARVRSTRGTEDTSRSAAFMTIDNTGTQDVSLTGASTDGARAVAIHETSTVDGARAMRVLEGGLLIQAGRGKVLEPGGYHVMLVDVRGTLAPGDEVDLTLEFSDGSTLDLTVPVEKITEEQAHHHAPGTEADHEH